MVRIIHSKNYVSSHEGWSFSIIFWGFLLFIEFMLWILLVFLIIKYSLKYNFAWYLLVFKLHLIMMCLYWIWCLTEIIYQSISQLNGLIESCVWYINLFELMKLLCDIFSWGIFFPYCISCREVRPLLPKRDVLSIILNCIGW